MFTITNGSMTTTYSTTGVGANTAFQLYVVVPTPNATQPESELEWLDRRVEETCRASWIEFDA